MAAHHPPTLPPVPFHLLPPAVRGAWNIVAAMPFENLSKILKYEEVGRIPERALRTPQEVLEDHRRFGTGATCFALVFLFHHLLERRGIPASLHTCDRRYGPDTHAAATVRVGDRTWLFDPGFHIVQPLPDEGGAAYLAPDNPNAMRVLRKTDSQYECYTGHAGRWTLRFVLKADPLSVHEFQRRWAASYHAEMMTYPVLTRFEQGRMIYLQKTMIVVRETAGSSTFHVGTDALADAIPEWYGIHPSIVRRALRICRKQ